ncbi:sugar-binding transcriptional regulator [Quadrisphaera sp. DSM 44207]|uniref:sugar-binding transcriptional regulator n=1 Tax=Quadrisphaera sp. DSM 44207 TaxID=1881057 RepID=UPI00088E7833|nr:sugar-binding domain-containing protein [Quadrisphaera sp. DSM 44207]SDQ83682.1 DNA-binding transcriptional regulator LsrR, DeoR family [Quadrisphaera sp. DSM 44207]
MENFDELRLMTKVARLYHTHGLRQVEVAERLRVSQSRVSRLLQQAEAAGIIRTVVAPPPGLHADLEEGLEKAYGLSEAHVVDAVSLDEAGLTRDLGQAMAAVVGDTALQARTVGYTSWSRTLREMVAALQPRRSATEHVVEMLGDLGPPSLQHEAARSTQRLADVLGSQPVFLRTPGVVTAPEIREALLEQDPFAREALRVLDSLDVAFVGIGNGRIVPPLSSGDNFFTEEQLAQARALGAVGEVCLHFLDPEGRVVPTPLDDLVIGVTAEQLRSARSRWAVAGGPSKLPAIAAALRGRWVDALVTDTTTASQLLASDG